MKYMFMCFNHKNVLHENTQRHHQTTEKISVKLIHLFAVYSQPTNDD